MSYKRISFEDLPSETPSRIRTLAQLRQYLQSSNKMDQETKTFLIDLFDGLETAGGDLDACREPRYQVYFEQTGKERPAFYRNAYQFVMHRTPYTILSKKRGSSIEVAKCIGSWLAMGNTGKKVVSRS